MLAGFVLLLASGEARREWKMVSMAFYVAPGRWPRQNGISHSHWVKICDNHNGQINLRAKQKYEVLSATLPWWCVIDRQMEGDKTDCYVDPKLLLLLTISRCVIFKTPLSTSARQPGVLNWKPLCATPFSGPFSVSGVLQGNTLALYILIICLDYVLHVSIKENRFKLKKNNK